MTWFYWLTLALCAAAVALCWYGEHVTDRRTHDDAGFVRDMRRVRDYEAPEHIGRGTRPAGLGQHTSRLP